MFGTISGRFFGLLFRFSYVTFRTFSGHSDCFTHIGLVYQAAPRYRHSSLFTFLLLQLRLEIFTTSSLFSIPINAPPSFLITSPTYNVIVHILRAPDTFVIVSFITVSIQSDRDLRGLARRSRSGFFVVSKDRLNSISKFEALFNCQRS